MAKEDSSIQRSVFAAFSPELFVSSPAWGRIQRILDSNRGGNYGLSGPRGSGKSWQIQRAVAHANDHDGLGVWFPSPSEYDPKAFLSALSEVVAQRYMDYYLHVLGGRSWTLRHRRLVVVASIVYLAVSCAALLYLSPDVTVWPILISAFGCAILAGIQGTRFARRRVPALPFSLRRPRLAFYMSFRYWMPAFLLLSTLSGVLIGGGAGHLESSAARAFGIFGAFVMVVCVAVVASLPSRLSSSMSLFSRATEVRTLARYSLALKESGEMSVAASRYGASAGWKRSRESTLIERQASLSSLVQSFREFASQLDEYFQGPIVIGIDELDKMEDADQLRSLLRDVKGVFDLKGVHYFVSMSDEAASAFQIWSRGGRNEFHSSFYQVINVEQSRTEFFNAVMERRGMTLPGPVQSAILIAACGVPREFVRLVETLTSEIDLGDVGHLAGALGRVEIEAFRKCLLSGAIGADDEDGLLGAYRECDTLANRMQSGCGDLLVASNWTPEFLTQLPSSATKDGVLLSPDPLMIMEFGGLASRVWSGECPPDQGEW